eukprot:1154750-Pelagomonas_calceolata.AAC.4
MVPGLVEDKCMFSALNYLKSPQRSSLKEKHINVCAREFKSMKFDFMSYPYPDAIGRWLDDKKKCARNMMLRWADYLGSPECAEACINMLPHLDQAEFRITDIKNLLSLPHQAAPATSYEKVERFCSEWLQCAFGDTARVKQFSPEDVNLLCLLPPDVLAKIAPMCCKYLLSHFSDVYAVIVDAELLGNFFKLEYALVEMWGGQDKLVTHSENDVAILLSLWCSGKSLSQEQMVKLSSVLRVSRLSRSFRCFFLRKLAWFSPPLDSDLEVFNGMLDEDGISKIHRVSNLFHDYPPAWIALGRRRSLPADATKRSELTACFSQDSLGRMLAKAEQSNAASCLKSDLFYFGGFYWQLILMLSMPERSLGVRLALSKKHPLPPPPAVRVSSSLHHQESSGQERHIASICAWIKCHYGWGSSDSFQGLKVTSPAKFGEVVHKGS